MKISALNRKLHRAFGGRVTAALADGYTAGTYTGLSLIHISEPTRP